ERVVRPRLERASHQGCRQRYLRPDLQIVSGSVTSIALRGTVVAAFTPLVVVPEKISAPPVQAHRLDGLQAVRPVLARHAREVPTCISPQRIWNGFPSSRKACSPIAKRRETAAWTIPEKDNNVLPAAAAAP